MSARVSQSWCTSSHPPSSRQTRKIFLCFVSTPLWIFPLLEASQWALKITLSCLTSRKNYYKLLEKFAQPVGRFNKEQGSAVIFKLHTFINGDYDRYLWCGSTHSQHSETKISSWMIFLSPTWRMSLLGVAGGCWGRNACNLFSPYFMREMIAAGYLDLNQPESSTPGERLELSYWKDLTTSSHKFIRVS